MRRKIGTALLSILLLIAALVVTVGFVIPCRLDVEISPKALYEYETIKEDDLQVYPSPLFVRGAAPVHGFTMEKVTNGNFHDIHVRYRGMNKVIHVEDVSVDQIDAVYSSVVHEGEPFRISDVNVSVRFHDGSHMDNVPFEIPDVPERCLFDEKIQLVTKYGSADVQVSFIKMTDLEASYTGTICEGDAFDGEKVKVDVFFEDGSSQPVTDTICDGPAYINGDSSYLVYTPYGTVPLNIHASRLIRATAEEGTYYSGSVYDGAVVLSFEDGSTRTVFGEDIEYETESVLTGGLNSFRFRYHGAEHILYVNARDKTSALLAAETYADEVGQSIAYVANDSVFATLRDVTEADYGYALAHIIVSRPENIQNCSARDSYGQSETLSSVCRRKEASFGIPMSFFNEQTKQMTGSSILIRQGQVLSPGYTSGSEICLTKEGALFSPPANVHTGELIAYGVTDTFVSADPLLIQDAKSYRYGVEGNETRITKCAVGMVSPGEYYILIANGMGMTYTEIQNVLGSLGCSYARPVGNGSNASAYMAGNPAYVLGQNTEGIDFLCFVP